MQYCLKASVHMHVTCIHSPSHIPIDGYLFQTSTLILKIFSISLEGLSYRGSIVHILYIRNETY